MYPTYSGSRPGARGVFAIIHDGIGESRFLVPCPAAHRNLDIAVVIPAYFERNPAVGDGLLAHIVPGTIVDLAVLPLVDSDDEHQPASLLQQPAREPFTPERQLLAFTRLQEMAVDAIARIAGADFIGRIEQMDIFSVGTLFVERDPEVHVHLVYLEIEPAREQTAEFGLIAQRLTQEHHGVSCLQVLADEFAGRQA